MPKPSAPQVKLEGAKQPAHRGSSSSPHRVRSKRMSAECSSAHRTAPLHVARAALLLAVVVLVSGCSYIDMVRRHRHLREAFEKRPCARRSEQ